MSYERISLNQEDGIAVEAQLDLEARLQTEAGRTSDHKEGVQAFLEKRTAEFTGN